MSYSDGAGGRVYREYHYENDNFPRSLTGITNELNHRYVYWEFDEEGYVKENRLSSGVDKYTFSKDADNRIIVTNPLGKL